jgi:hypothetical protein
VGGDGDGERQPAGEQARVAASADDDSVVARDGPAGADRAVGIDGDDLVTSHLRRQLKLRNIERDPRVVLSFVAPPEPGVFLAPHAIVRAHATIDGPSEDAWELLDRLAKVYMGPEVTFPAPRGPGWIVRHRIEKVGGVGPWA